MTIRSNSSLRHGSHKQHDHDHHGDLDHCDVDHHGDHDHNGEDPLEDHDAHGDDRHHFGDLDHNCYIETMITIATKTMITIATTTMRGLKELMERLHTGQL